MNGGQRKQPEHRNLGRRSMYYVRVERKICVVLHILCFDSDNKLGSVSLSAAVTSSHQHPAAATSLLRLALAAELSPVSTDILREEKFSGHELYISLRASREITHI